jgi:hypothetical protein
MSPLPLAMESAATWGRASGRDSKITNNTPENCATLSLQIYDNFYQAIGDRNANK